MLIPSISLAQQGQSHTSPHEMHPLAAKTWRSDHPIDSKIVMAPDSILDYSIAMPFHPKPISGVFQPLNVIANNFGILSPNETASRGVAVDMDFIDTLDPTQAHALEFALPEGGSIQIWLTRSEQTLPNQIVWYGKIAGVANSSVIMALDGPSMRMIVRNLNSNGRTFGVRGTPVGHMLYEHVNLSVDCQPQPAMLSHHDDAGSAGSADGARIRGNQPPAQVDPNRLDIMIVYTDEARAAFGSESAVNANSAALIADLNLRLSNSGVPFSAAYIPVRWTIIAGYTQPPLAVSDDLSVILTDLSVLNGQADFNGVVSSDSITDSIQNTRDQYRPDFVHMITHNTNGSGIGWKPGSLESMTSTGTGYAVSRSDVALDGGTFGHEVGHNLGGCHNANASRPSCNQGVNDTDRGIEGYCDVPDDICGGCEDIEYRTTMAYAVASDLFGRATRVEAYSVTGLTASLSGSFGSCSVNLWASDARVADTINLSRQWASQYNLVSTQYWVATDGIFDEFGLFEIPGRSVQAGLDRVNGGVLNGVVRVKAGTYTSGPQVWSGNAKINTFGGAAVFR